MKRNGIGVFTVERVSSKIQVCGQALISVKCPLAAICTDKSSHRTNQVTVGVMPDSVETQVDRGNIMLGKTLQLNRLRNTILVLILPYTNIRKLFILSVEYTVRITI
ncbi:hypothetical protein D3C76_188470 [compost metagenome]